ncbi:MAG: hypothetical protein ACXVDA_19485, partial [Ktedonobacterales bacterium]
MSSNSGSHHEQDHAAASDVSQGKATRRMADPHELAEEIEVLEEQIAVLEEGLPLAPGMERAALAKEIASYRARLDSKRQVLRQRRGID